MSNVNFLKLEYRLEPSRNEKRCGIMDGPEGPDCRPAYTTTDESQKWNATILNSEGHSFQFVPVDRNIIIFKENGHDKDSTCDGMLLVEEKSMIAFIELKDVKTGGYADAISQLENTIKHFLRNHNHDIFRIRRAYAANIAHPQFHYNMKDEIERFRSLKFVLFPEATVRIP